MIEVEETSACPNILCRNVRRRYLYNIMCSNVKFIYNLGQLNTAHNISFHKCVFIGKINIPPKYKIQCPKKLVTRVYYCKCKRLINNVNQKHFMGMKIMQRETPIRGRLAQKIQNLFFKRPQQKKSSVTKKFFALTYLIHTQHKKIIFIIRGNIKV